MRMSSQQPKPRSEQVRTRRSTTSQKQVTAVSKRVAGVASQPPVMARVITGSTPRHQARQTKARRGVNVALNVPGAEVRLPALPAIHFGWRLLSAAFCVGLVMLLSWMWNDPTFVVAEANVQGVQRLTTADVSSVVKPGENVFYYEPIKLEEALYAAFPDISFAYVNVDLPAALDVYIEERTPVLEWQQEGLSLWVDAGGVAFLPRGTLAEPLPVVQSTSKLPIPAYLSQMAAAAGVAQPDGQAVVPPDPQTAMDKKVFISGDMIAAVQALKDLVPAGQPVMYSAEYGFGWKDANGWQVYFGSRMNDVQLKSLVYQAIVRQLTAQGIDPILISVEDPHAPFYRLE